ncbi:MAG TPA: GFA family protein, partial [Burkholderiales bacterium]|nr:GFA family protein [Burkholderiales bacterium]
MKVDGGCYCGNIKFEAEIDPDGVRICHCTDCQHLTGSAFRVNVSVAKDKIRFSGGEAKTYIKTAESGAKRVHAFCPECGTPVFSTQTGEIKGYGLRVGTIRQRAQLAPRLQQW